MSTHHLLIIEDDRDLRELICELFELQGYRVSTACNGKKGVAKALQDRPDLIICDVMMPEMDGYATVQSVRSQSSLAHIPFIFLTARGTRQDFRKGMNLGADDFVAKPFDNQDLIRVVEIRLARLKEFQSEPAQQVAQLRGQLEEQMARLQAVAQLNSHELRGPLVRMIGVIRLLLDGVEQPGGLSITELLTLLHQSAQEMDTIIHQINYLAAGVESHS